MAYPSPFSEISVKSKKKKRSVPNSSCTDLDPGVTRSEWEEFTQVVGSSADQGMTADALRLDNAVKDLGTEEGDHVSAG